MVYSKERIHRIVGRIPRGKITIPSLIAKALGVPQSTRAVGREVCKCKEPEMYRVILKGRGKDWDLPHPNNAEDCEKRARFLEKEKIHISPDRKKVLNAKEILWTPR